MRKGSKVKQINNIADRELERVQRYEKDEVTGEKKYNTTEH